MKTSIKLSIIVLSFFIIFIYYYFSNTKHESYTKPFVKLKHESYTKPFVKLKHEIHTIYGNNIFNIDKTNNSKDVLIFNTNTYIGLVTCYHNSNPQQDINELRNTYKNIYIIIIDGEPMNLTNTTPDMIISTKHEQQYFPPNTPAIHVPYFAYLFKQNLNLSHLSSLIKSPSTINPIKPYFCAFINSNCDESQFKGVKLRGDFFKLLNKRSNNRVHSLGKCYNNFKLESQEKDNIQILKNYKFCIAFENEPTYNSEKIIYPILANCIPIYYGSPIYKNFFNPNRLIDINNYDNFDSCINHILEIDSNDKLFLDIINQPFLKNNTIDKNLFSFSFGKGLCFRQIYNNLPIHIKKYTNFNSLYDNNIHFITFADGIKYTTNRIISEAIHSNYFDVCKDMSNSIPDFMNKHHTFITNNKRGFGYWIWKHNIILEEYKNLNDNDILIYSDSGNTIIKYNLQMIEYLNTLINGSGMLFFPIHYKEGIWSKMDTIKHIFPDENDDFINNILDTYQTMASLMMFRKCQNTTSYLEEVSSYSTNYHLINDDPSVIPNIDGFKENRHDQTIFSLTKHKYNFDISYDNFDDSKTVTTTSDELDKCFIITRKK